MLRQPYISVQWLNSKQLTFDVCTKHTHQLCGFRVSCVRHQNAEHRLNRPGRNTPASKCGYETEKCGFGIEQKDHFPDC